MTDQLKQDLLPVTQADRDAAADIWRDYIAKVGEVMVERQMRDGRRDTVALVQAFARHRINHRQPGQGESKLADELARWISGGSTWGISVPKSLAERILTALRRPTGVVEGDGVLQRLERDYEVARNAPAGWRIKLLGEAILRALSPAPDTTEVGNE